MTNFFSSQRQRLFQLKAMRDGAAPQNPGSQPVNESHPFIQCPGCGSALTRRQLAETMWVCPSCGHHFPMDAYYRLKTILDDHSFRELDRDLTARDPLHFPGYAKKLLNKQQSTGLSEGIVTAKGRIGGHGVIVGVMDSRFFMGSMGVALGEKVARCAEKAQKYKLPLILFTASGGARMQEGILSLMQMAKTSAAIERFSQAGGLLIVCLTHPTTGGVTASFASLGDITLAEPGALIGFAGPRVIQQTIGQSLPQGFQQAEFLQEHGFVDQVVPRSQMRPTLIRLLDLHRGRRKR